MIAALLLSASVAAAELPPKPIRPDRFPFECRQVVGITAEQRTPIFDASGVAVCSGVLLPTSEAFYLQEIKTWADENDAALRAKIADLELENAKTKSAVIRVRKTALWVSVVSITTTGAVAAFCASQE